MADSWDIHLPCTGDLMYQAGNQTVDLDTCKTLICGLNLAFFRVFNKTPLKITTYYKLVQL